MLLVIENIDGRRHVSSEIFRAQIEIFFIFGEQIDVVENKTVPFRVLLDSLGVSDVH